eukprot:SAG11_NODE_25582_length_356_cov_57.680934_1_plen_72_part_10
MIMSYDNPILQKKNYIKCGTKNNSYWKCGIKTKLFRLCIHTQSNLTMCKALNIKNTTEGYCGSKMAQTEEEL